MSSLKVGENEQARRQEFRSLSHAQQDVINRVLEGQKLLSKDLNNSIAASEATLTARLSAQDAQLSLAAEQRVVQIALRRENELNQCKRRLLKALAFPEINQRRNMIEGRIDDFGDTLRWIFKPAMRPHSPRIPHTHSPTRWIGSLSDLSLSDDRDMERSEANAALPEDLSHVPETVQLMAAQSAADSSRTPEDPTDSTSPSEEGRRSRSPSPASQHELGTSHHSLSPPTPPLHPFVEWLEGSDDLFWISGKPGSGKSTLMDFVYHKMQPEQIGNSHLQRWANPRPVGVLSFFFFRPSTTPLLRTIEGFWRSLCFQLLDIDQALADIVRENSDGSAPVNLRSALMPNGSSAESWTDKELQTWFNYLIRRSTLAYCLLIDGLDEMEGNRQRLLDVILDLCKLHPNLKICSSSRPESPFLGVLKQFPHLLLHDFNHDDIFQDCTRRLAGTKAAKYISQIADRAEGVFLWAHLLSSDLAEAAKEGEDQESLDLRFKECPDEMTDLFKHMLQRQTKFHLKYPKPYLRLVDFASSINMSTTVFELLMATLPAERSPRWTNLTGRFDDAYLAYLEEQLQGMGSRIETACAGLVQCLPWRRTEPWGEYVSPQYPSMENAIGSKVAFVHRSVQDFLREDEAGAQYYAKFELSDDQAAALLTRGAAATLFINDKKLKDDIFDRDIIHYLEATTDGGRNPTTVPVVDAFFRQLTRRCLPSFDDDKTSRIRRYMGAPDLPLFENIALAFTSMHTLDGFVRAYVEATNPLHKDTAAAYALCTYLTSSWNRFRGDLVSAVSPGLDPLKEYTFTHHRPHLGPFFGVACTRPLLDHVVVARVENLGSAYDLDFLRFPDHFFSQHAETDAHSGVVEGWLLVDDWRIQDIFPVPDENCEFMKDRFEECTILVFNIHVQDVLKNDIFPVRIVRWKPSGTRRFLDLRDDVVERFRQAHTPASWDSLGNDFFHNLTESYNTLVAGLSVEEGKKILLEVPSRVEPRGDDSSIESHRDKGTLYEMLSSLTEGGPLPGTIDEDENDDDDQTKIEASELEELQSRLAMPWRELEHRSRSITPLGSPAPKRDLSANQVLAASEPASNLNKEQESTEV